MERKLIAENVQMLNSALLAYNTAQALHERCRAEKDKVVQSAPVMPASFGTAREAFEFRELILAYERTLGKSDEAQNRAYDELCQAKNTLAQSMPLDGVWIKVGDYAVFMSRYADSGEKTSYEVEVVKATRWPGGPIWQKRDGGSRCKRLNR